jgi:hypothetical protein
MTFATLGIEITCTGVLQTEAKQAETSGINQDPKMRMSESYK